jgi:phosphoribosylformylglycinamidine (FGAM) synthase-like enzyme
LDDDEADKDEDELTEVLLILAGGTAGDAGLTGSASSSSSKISLNKSIGGLAIQTKQRMEKNQNE